MHQFCRVSDTYPLLAIVAPYIDKSFNAEFGVVVLFARPSPQHTKHVKCVFFWVYVCIVPMLYVLVPYLVSQEEDNVA